jgi:hypothetical protein
LAILHSNCKAAIVPEESQASMNDAIAGEEIAFDEEGDVSMDEAIAENIANEHKAALAEMIEILSDDG